VKDQPVTSDLHQIPIEHDDASGQLTGPRGAARASSRPTRIGASCPTEVDQHPPTPKMAILAKCGRGSPGAAAREYAEGMGVVSGRGTGDGSGFGSGHAFGGPPFNLSLVSSALHRTPSLACARGGGLSTMMPRGRLYCR
jgi:hypothetical protein